MANIGGEEPLLSHRIYFVPRAISLLMSYNRSFVRKHTSRQNPCFLCVHMYFNTPDFFPLNYAHYHHPFGTILRLLGLFSLSPPLYYGYEFFLLPNSLLLFIFMNGENAYPLIGQPPHKPIHLNVLTCCSYVCQNMFHAIAFSNLTFVSYVLFHCYTSATLQSSDSRLFS